MSRLASPHAVPAGVAAMAALGKLARQTGRDPQVLLARYAVERLLVRAAESRHADRFVTKGGMLVVLVEGCTAAEARATTDLDVALPGYAGTLEDFQAVMSEVAALVPADEDGVRYDPESLRVQAVREGNAAGGSVAVRAHVGGAMVKVKVDVTFDERVAYAETVADSLPALLPGMARVPVRRVPWESVLADKVQALVRHGAGTTRLRDYYDLHALTTRHALDVAAAAPLIRASFDALGVELPASADDVAALSDANAERHAGAWEEERRRKGFKLPTPPFPELVAALREALEPFLAAARPEAPRPF